jgi:5-methylcytosine-specific restriction endonuclease McrA
MPWSSSTRPGSTRASRALRAQTLAAWPICYLQYPGCTQTSTEDDHVQPVYLRPDLDMDPSNHRGACKECHATKSAKEGHQARPTRRRPAEQHPGKH